MKITGVSTPMAQAVAGLAAAVVNLGLLFGWYTWTTAQVAGVNLVVGAALAVVSAFRAGAQRQGRLVDTTRGS